MLPPVAGTPEFQRAADVALRLINARSRAAIRRAPIPTDDQVLELAVKLMDAGAHVEDEMDVRRGIALAKSRVTTEQLQEAV